MTQFKFPKDLDLRFRADTSEIAKKAFANMNAEEVRLTQEQAGELLAQILMSGDVTKYVRVDTRTQTLVYTPGMEADRLRDEIAALRAALQGVRDWYERDGSVGGCSMMIEECVEPWTNPSPKGP